MSVMVMLHRSLAMLLALDFALLVQEVVKMDVKDVRAVAIVLVRLLVEQAVDKGVQVLVNLIVAYYVLKVVNRAAKLSV